MIEMSVDKETVPIGNAKASSTPPLQLQHPSECAGSYDDASAMTDVAAADPDGTDGPATCPVPASAVQEAQTSPAKSHDQTEHAELGARPNEIHLGSKNGVQQPRQQQQQQQKLSKRRSTTNAGFKHPQSGKRRRRANSESDSALPTNFLLGGNIFDPLNLNSLLDEEVNRALNAETPKSSPLPAKNQEPVEILIPRDITDPLNLNSAAGDGAGFLVSPFKTGGRRRNRNRHHGAGGRAGGGGAGAGGASAPQLDLSDSERTGETTTNASSLPSATSVSGSDLEATSVLAAAATGTGAHAHELHPSNAKEEAAALPASASAPQPRPRGPDDSSSVSAGGPNQHSGGRPRRRRRFSGKTEPPLAQSTPAGKPWAEDRGRGVGAGRGHAPGGGSRQRNQQHKHQQQQQQHNKSKFHYGNYNKYYGYRNPGLSEDPRFRVLRPEWFRGKEVLDLGCNTGQLTLCIAKRLRPARILGLDIDGALVHAARQNIRHYLSELEAQEARRAAAGKEGEEEEEERPAGKEGEEETQTGGGEPEGGRRERGGRDPADGERGAENGNGERAAKRAAGSADAAGREGSGPSADGGGEERAAEEAEPGYSGGAPGDHPGSCAFPVSLRISRGPIAAPPLADVAAAPPGEFPANVSFVKVNYVLENDALLATQRPEYDVVLCLSVTKWVHLNWGDSGLKRLFHRVYRHLRPGGRFILEPQPWDTYAKRKMLTDDMFRNYHSIRLKPEQFSAFLTGEVGFSSYELIGTPKSSSRGFQRPIYLFHK